MRTFILAILILLPGAVAWGLPKAHSPCEAIRSAAAEAAATSSASLVEKLEPLQLPGAQVVFIGESHDDLESRQHLPDLIQAIDQVSPRDCLLIEYSSDLGVPLTQNLNSSEMTAQLLETARRVLPFLWQPDADAFRQMVQPWVEAATTAREQGMQIFTIDQEGAQALKTLFSSFSRSLIERNAFMANRIESLIQSGQCKNAIAINGSAHLNFETADGRLQTLPALNQRRGISSRTVYLASKERFDERVQEVAETCSWLPVSGISPPLILREAERFLKVYSTELEQPDLKSSRVRLSKFGAHPAVTLY